MGIEIQPQGRFGTFLHRTMEEQGVEVKDLAKDIESTYEHIRKLIKGMAYPSQYMLERLAKRLKFDLKDASVLVDQDKMQRKFGKNFKILTGKDPIVEEFVPLIHGLTPEQREMFKAQMSAVGKQNRANRSS
jgi:transcriptional regulator with XRE-family HTH domain